MRLTDEQAAFLEKEFQLSSSRIAMLSINEIIELREKCFEVEVEEATKADNENADISARGEIAADIVEVIVDYLKSSKRVAV